MHLETYLPRRDQRKLSESIDDIRPVILRYVYRGRNAWYATWTTHYFEGCMHDTVASGQGYAESQRGPGNVFFIREIPAIAFIGNRFVGAIAQINTPSPLADYSARSLREEQLLFFLPNGSLRVGDCNKLFELDKDGDLLSCKAGVAMGIKGLRIVDAFASFDPDSPFWRKRQPSKDSIIRVWQERKALALDKAISGQILNMQVSFAMGTQNFLGWKNSTESRVTPDYTVRLALELGRLKRIIHKA